MWGVIRTLSNFHRGCPFGRGRLRIANNLTPGVCDRKPEAVGGVAQPLADGEADDGETTVVGNERYEVKAARNSVLFSRGLGCE